MPVDHVHVAADVLPIVSHAMAHNRISPVQKVTLTNRGGLLTGVEVRINLRDDQGPLSEPFVAHADLEQDGTTILHELTIHLDAAAMNHVEEARPGTIEVQLLHEGEVIGRTAQPVEVLAARQWLWNPPGLALELLAAHVMPNAPEISDLLGDAASHLEKITGSSQIDGYQSGPDRVDAIVQAVYEAVVGWRLRYSEPPASWAEQGQKIRTPADLHDSRLGTCLDTTLLFAAALEQAGVRPLVWLLTGHAFVGWWRHEQDSWSAVSSDVPDVVNRLALGQIGVLETTLATEREHPAPFREAHASAHQRIVHEPDSIVGVLDVWSARRSRILPLPAIKRLADGASQTVLYVPAQHSVAPAEQKIIAAEAHRAGTLRGTPAPPRVHKWKNALLDLSLRNRLINFSARGAVHLNVSPHQLPTLEDCLTSGKTITLAPGDSFDNVYRHRDGIQRAAELPAEVLDDALTRQATIYTNLIEETYLPRLRNLAYKARTLEEETGANNLYLALGTLVWELDGKPLRSPLVLVPLRLKTARGRGAAYRMVLDDTEASTPNYCLLEKLRLSFGLSLPSLDHPELDAHGIDLASTLRGVRESLVAKGLPFRVEETAEISMLQFAKYRLWKDLEENWETLLRQPLAHHLAHSPTAEFRDPAKQEVAPDLDQLGLLCPIPADGSQLAAIADAVAGRTFVLEGPPGTGKSQTIANLLARGIAEGKRVLFVAEKRAALEVVARRVRAIGLDPLTLDLHDRDSRPASVRLQVLRALELASHSDSEGLHATTEHARAAMAALSRYAARLHEPNGAGFSLYKAATSREAIGAGVALQLPPHTVLPGTEATVEALRSVMTGLPYVADAARPSHTGPWSFAQVDDPATVDFAAVARACRDADAHIAHVQGNGALPDPAREASTPADLMFLTDLFTQGLPSIRLLDEVRTPRWRNAARAMRDEFASLVTQTQAALGVATPAALNLPLSEIHEHAIAAAHSSFFGRRKRLLSVVDELRPGLTAGAVVPAKHVGALVDGLLRIQTQVHTLSERCRAIPGLWLPSPADAVSQTAVATLDRRIGWLTGVADKTSVDIDDSFHRSLRAFLAAPRPIAEPVAVALRTLAIALSTIQKALGARDQDFTVWSGDAGLIGRWLENNVARDAQDPELGSLTRWLALRQHIRPLRAWGLEEAHQQILAGELSGDEAALALERGLVEASLIERRRTQGLDAFEQDAHNRTVSRFMESANQVRENLQGALSAQALARRSFSNEATSGQIGALRRELTRQRGGLSVRDLIGSYGSLITEITPCVLVSPGSLSRFFPVGSVEFDLVVFDEASQIRVADAIGAIGRAHSAVIVGDSKQMPPTSFAEIGLHLDEDDEESLSTGVVDDEESILSECVQARVQRHWLSWHYRSQDESLIAFSNARYYEGRLSSFPAPTIGTSDPSTDGHGINRVAVNGTFLRSGKGKALRTNPQEAQAILDEVRRRFRAAPAGTMPSIGIVTFNMQQRSLIETMIRDTNDPRLIAALDATTGDGLFVKNLENVQGDERDVILFSTAFSVNDKGVLPLNFGPLNLAGGERRLNVAITRARRQVIIYTSFEPSQLRAEDTSSQGIKHLREYLDVAAGGTAELVSTTGRTLVRDRHRDDIAQRLRARGISVQTDVGLSDFRIDLRLAKGDAPNQPLVAVLLDGPGWARRATVNDRDGLPTQVLGDMLKWPVVERVWLPAWLDNPEQVVDRLTDLLETSEFRPLGQETAQIPDEIDLDASWMPVPDEEHGNRFATPSGPSHAPEEATDVVMPTRAAPSLVASAAHSPTHLVQPHAPADRIATTRFRPWTPRVLGDVSHLDALASNVSARAKVRALLTEGILAEGPVHGDRLAKKVANAFGLERVTQSRIASILEVARQRPDEYTFYWPGEVDRQLWREFRRDPGQDRNHAHISPLELANAMREIASLSGGITFAELKKETSEIFGFKRLTQGLGDTMDLALSVGLTANRLRWDGTFLRPA